MLYNYAVHARLCGNSCVDIHVDKVKIRMLANVGRSIAPIASVYISYNIITIVIIRKEGEFSTHYTCVYI